MRHVHQPAPVLLPTRSPARSSHLWRVSCGVGKGLLLVLMLVAALSVWSCTIHEIVLYKTIINPTPRPTI